MVRPSTAVPLSWLALAAESDLLHRPHHIFSSKYVCMLDLVYGAVFDFRAVVCPYSA
jgi:hypothetical protein